MHRLISAIKKVDSMELHMLIEVANGILMPRVVSYKPSAQMCHVPRKGRRRCRPCFAAQKAFEESSFSRGNDDFSVGCNRAQVKVQELCLAAIDEAKQDFLIQLRMRRRMLQ
jgi:hypothetical protein